MKTRQLTLIGTVIALSALSIPFIISETYPKPEILRTINLELIDKLVDRGCTEPAINHTLRHSNLLDVSFDGTYYVDTIGYPDDLSKIEFDKCVNLILKIRTSDVSKPEPEEEMNNEMKVDNANEQCMGNELCISGTITRIVDGDTIYLDEIHEIRLSLTNTPERHQIGFYDASQFTEDLCPVGSHAIVDQDDLQPYDVYGRMLGKVTCDDKVLNSELLYEGHADILKQYCSTSEFSDELWAQEFGC